MGFSRQEYWSGLPFPSPGYLPEPGIEPRSAKFLVDSFFFFFFLQVDSLPTEPPEVSCRAIVRDNISFSKVYMGVHTHTHTHTHLPCVDRHAPV